MDITHHAIDSIQESIKDCLLIIDLNRFDPDNLAIIFDKLNKVIIASTLLSRHISLKSDVSGPANEILETKLHLLNTFKLLAHSIKTNDISRTHDLIRLDLRDTLVRWIIQLLPQIRLSLIELPSGQAQSSTLN